MAAEPGAVCTRHRLRSTLRGSARQSTLPTPWGAGGPASKSADVSVNCIIETPLQKHLETHTAPGTWVRQPGPFPAHPFLFSCLLRGPALYRIVQTRTQHAEGIYSDAPAHPPEESGPRGAQGRVGSHGGDTVPTQKWPGAQAGNMREAADTPSLPFSFEPGTPVNPEAPP